MSPAAFWKRVARSTDAECWVWLGAQNGNGRGRARFNGRMQYAYRIAWELTHGKPIPDDRLACHRCDNPICVNPSHIFVGSVADNSADAKAKSRLVPPPVHAGLSHPAAFVAPDAIAAAVSEYLGGNESQEDVAARYGVHQTTLSLWVRAKTRADAGLTPSRKLKPCGTRAAFERHRRNGEKPCEACRIADLEHQRARRQAKRLGINAKGVAA